MEIISLIGAVLGIAFYLIKRRAQTNDNPAEQHRKAYAQIDADIANPDATAASLHHTDALAELERLARVQNREGNSSGSNAGENQSQ